MLQGEHFAILSTCIKLPFVIKIFFSIFEWSLMTGFTVEIKACEIITFCYYLGGQTTIVTLNLHSHTMTHQQHHHDTITLIQRLLNVNSSH